jgi:serine/threonine protein kinase
VLPQGWQGTGLQVESGQSWLYQARRDGDTSGLYAIKRLKNPRRAARFAREAETMVTLHERGVSVPQIVASDLGCDRPWFAMAWFADGSLEAAVEDTRFVGNAISGLQTLQLLVSTLADVHANDVAHRDLKPANVLVEGDSLALTDFGLCLEIVEVDDEAVRLTETREAVGSRYYISPENEGGLNPTLDQRPADFYAFGKLVWAVLTGRQPLPRERQLEDENLLARALGDSRLSPLDMLLRELLNRDPRARLADWGIVTEELRAVEAALGGRPRGTPRAVDADLVRVARRVRAADRLNRELEQAATQQRQQAWYSDLVSALAQRASLISPSLEPLQAELSDLLDIVPTTGGPVSPSQLAAAGVPEIPGSVPNAAAGPSVAAVFLIHSSRGLAAFPTFAIRLWPVVGPDGVWFVRVPTMTRAGEQETVPVFLLDSLFRLAGPFRPYSQATVENGLAIVDETSGMFVSLVEQYVRALGDDEDPAAPDTWATRRIEPVELDPHARPALTDTMPPQLVEFRLEPPSGTPSNDPTVTVTCRIVDDRSGIGDGGPSSPSQARLRSASGQMRDVLFTPLTRIAGDEHDGTYSSSFTLDEHSERGVWRVEYVSLVDNAGNHRSIATDALAAQGFPASILVR